MHKMPPCTYTQRAIAISHLQAIGKSYAIAKLLLH
jgi:hypothetical protein